MAGADAVAVAVAVAVAAAPRRPRQRQRQRSCHALTKRPEGSGRCGPSLFLRRGER
jgi:hypothetical protein